jgi:ABC-2 type transport system ATP-binding protein
MSDVITTERLVKRYAGKPVVCRLNLRVPEGSIFAFLGDNGAGKSTTMKVLVGQIPPDGGRAEILGYNCWSKAKYLRHRVGYVPDRPRLYDWMTVGEIGWFTAAFHRPGFLNLYKDWAEKLGLDPTKKLKNLSKGGYARVGLALALAPDPEVLLLDEPTSGLDLLTRREFLASMVDLAGTGRTILISSHGIAEVERIASHVGIIKEGRLLLSCPMEDLKRRFKRVRARFDGVPPDAASLGTVLQREGTGQRWRMLIQDPNEPMLAALRDAPGVHDFDEAPVSLEEIYAALMARRAETANPDAWPRAVAGVRPQPGDEDYEGDDGDEE